MSIFNTTGLAGMPINSMRRKKDESIYMLDAEGNKIKDAEGNYIKLPH